MSELPPALPVHSLAEACLYLMVKPCDACAGPVHSIEHRVQHDAGAQVLTVPVICRSCSRETIVSFDTRRIETEDAMSGPVVSLQVPPDPQAMPTINPTDEPSAIIDVAGWLTLYTVISQAAHQAAEQAQVPDERKGARQMLIQAARCLDEALKFYDVDNDLPPEDAFLRDESRRQLREQPELFARQRLIELRAKLPVQRATRDRDTKTDPSEKEKTASSSSGAKKRRWWQRKKD